MNNRKSALGKGLGALLGSEETYAKELNIQTPGNNIISNILISTIAANPFQPRTQFDEDALQELALSIKTYGVIQPITVKCIEAGKYQLISGERRLKASKIAGEDSIPAYIRTAEDNNMLELALVENIQREDLDPIEIAITFKRLLEECNLTQEALSERVGKQRTTVTNYIRLLKLPAEIQQGIRNKQISMGHARALINVEDLEKQLHIFQDIIEYGLSVREVEEIVKSIQDYTFFNRTSSDVNKSEETYYPKYEKIESDLREYLGTKVKIMQKKGGKGKIEIPFTDEKDFEKIISVFNLWN